jgi:serine/threonine protein kinase
MSDPAHEEPPAGVPGTPTETTVPLGGSPADEAHAETLLANGETVRTPHPEVPFGDSAAGESAAREPEAPPTLRGYRIQRELARGGMGVVYLATQEPPGREVALKVVRLQGPHREETVLRFQREVGAVAKMDHPNIISVYEVGAADGLLYFSMSLVEGGTLKDTIQEQRLALRPCVELVERMARALHYAHERGVLHRDVKPENILVDRAGVPYLTDFGLARDASDQARVTQTGAIAGTPLYMSPEQASGQSGLDHRTDIYSLGATLYELLALRPPFAAKSLVALLANIAAEEPPRLRSVDPRIPRDVETIVEKAMRKDRNDRYTDAGAFADDLGRFLAGKPIAARPVPAWQRVWMSARRNPVVAALATALLLAAVIAAGTQVRVRAERLKRQEASLAAARGQF